jgi:hypothetical protein
MLMPNAPHHDGARLWIVVFPFLGLLAGYGLDRSWRALSGRLRGLVPMLVLLPAAVQLAWVHPYELAYYGEVVGGVRGAHRLGLETTYWMDAYTGPVLAWMNRELPPGARVEVSDNGLALQLQQAYGRLRRDIVVTPSGDPAEWRLVQMRQGLMGPATRELLARTRPDYRLELQGVPLVAIYRLVDLPARQEVSGDE